MTDCLDDPFILGQKPQGLAANIEQASTTLTPRTLSTSLIGSEFQEVTQLNNVRSPQDQESFSKLIRPTEKLAVNIHMGHEKVADEKETQDSAIQEKTQTEVTKILIVQPIEGTTITEVGNLQRQIPPRIVYLFTGQGAQWQGMGVYFLEGSEDNAFSRSIKKSSTVLEQLGFRWNLVSILRHQVSEIDIDSADIAIPSTVTLQIGLVDYLKDAGLQADIVLGHSTGEIAAAYAAGIVSQEDAIKIAFHLGKTLRETELLNGQGKMMSIGLPVENVAACIGRVCSGNLDLACLNSPRSVTVAGDTAAMDDLKENLEEANVFCRELNINTAYHSRQMDAIKKHFGDAVASIEHHQPGPVAFYSSVLGEQRYDLEASYWVENITSKVLFSAVLNAIIDIESETELIFVELGPRPHLRRPTKENLNAKRRKDGSFKYYPILSVDQKGTHSITEMVKILQSNYMSDGEQSQISKIDKTENASNASNTSNTRLTKELVPISNKISLPAPFLKHDRKILEIYQDLSNKLSSLVALPPLTEKFTVADYGLDSHVAMQFGSWISTRYGAKISIQDILDLKSLINLASSLQQKVTNVEYLDQTPNIKRISPIENHDIQDLQVQNGNGPNYKATPLPKLPLPDLESTMEHYYASVEVFGDEDELLHTRSVIEDFKNSEQGKRLQNRLVERANDPNLDCWLAELYNSSNFLDRNGPLVPFSSFFYTHKLGPVNHTQAERAAIITTAVAEYKELLEQNLIEPPWLNDQPTCMYLFPFLFNTSRKARNENDIMERFPGNDYIVVLRKGRAFKVDLYEDGRLASVKQLRATFESILKGVDACGPNVGILTSDDRKLWAKNREILEADARNLSYLRTIEAAVFLVCLDSGSPEGASERARHFHFGDGSNRWNDKSIQMVVCENAVSGCVGDHSMLDAGTVLGLNNHVKRAIFRHREQEDQVNNDDEAVTTPNELQIFVSLDIQQEVHRVEQDFQRNTEGVTHAFVMYKECGGSLLRSYKCPPKSYFQLVVLLASRYHFGYNSALWETVSLGNFHRGRVEINQVLRPCMVEFCEAIEDSKITMARKRELLFESVNAHTSSVMRAVRGRGVDRHITSLRQMIQPDEPVLPFFDDPVYARSRPRKIMSHCHETGMAEKGFLLRDPDAIWVHYEVEEDSVLFSVTGLQDAPRVFCGLIEKAAQRLKDILVYEA